MLFVLKIIQFTVIIYGDYKSKPLFFAAVYAAGMGLVIRRILLLNF